MKAVALMILVATIAGCFGGSDDPQPRIEEVGQGDIAPSFLHMDNCLGFTVFLYYGGGGMNPARPPAGWTVDDGPGTSVSMLLWRCERVGLDGLERPATILWERANNALVPAACATDIPESAGISYVLNVVTDDAGLAQRLRTQYGLPVYEAEIHFEPGDGFMEAGWSIEGRPSSLVALDDGTRQDSSRNPSRWVWSNGTMTGWMDVTRTYSSSLNTDNRLGHGQISPPHVLGIDGVFAGPTIVNDDAELHGAIELRGKDCA